MDTLPEEMIEHLCSYLNFFTIKDLKKLTPIPKGVLGKALARHINTKKEEERQMQEEEETQSRITEKLQALFNSDPSNSTEEEDQVKQKIVNKLMEVKELF